MTTESMVCHDLHMRYTDGDGRKRLVCHRVWNSDLFIKTRQAEVANVNAEAQRDGRKQLAKAEPVTREQYIKERL